MNYTYRKLLTRKVIGLELITTENGSKRTFSASQINKIYNCPRMWAFEYLEDIKPPPNYPMKKGTYIHAVIETFNDRLEPLEGRTEKHLKKELQEAILETIDDSAVTE